MDLSRWMSEVAAVFPTRTLFDTITPGAHDACSYGITPGSTEVPGAGIPPWVQAVRERSSDVGAVLAAWSKAQGLSVGAQLRAGVRYLDIRITLHDGVPWTCHGLYSVPWKDVESDIVQFIDSCPREILILDFHEFYAMNSGQVNLFCRGVVERLRQHAVPPAQLRDPLVELQRRGYSLVLRCDHPDVSHWPETALFIQTGLIDSQWADTPDIEALRRFLEARVRQRRDGTLFVAQGILTENLEAVLRGLVEKPSSLQDLAAVTNPAVLLWAASWPRDLVNIVMADWVEELWCRKVINLNYDAAAGQTPA
jgi:hypothetical protein